MPQTIVADTGFWVALFDPADAYHADAQDIAEDILDQRLIIPWPCLYETLNTKFVKRRTSLAAFERRVARPNFVRLDDSPYREQALLALFEQLRQFERRSLTDLVICQILEDPSIRVDVLVTSDRADFGAFRGLRGLELFLLAAR